MDNNLTINIIANAALGPLLSGGDKIFIECARRWARVGHKINIFVWEDGLQMCRRNYLEGVNYILWPAERFKRFGFFILYLARVIIGCIKVWKYDFKSKSIIYSASDFWPDFIPAFVIKSKNKEVKWIAGFYMFAPRPWQKDSPYKGKRWFVGLFYWLNQFPVYWLVKRYADMVFVTSEPDVDKFITKRRNRDKTVVVRGGVDTRPSVEYLGSGKAIPIEKKEYDACFVGRFHPQKGVLDLIEIWKLVCEEKPYAKLAIIGDGPLRNKVKEKIRNNNLEKNIDLLGFKDGEGKYNIFKQSKIIVHPAIYDSGGMAAAEAMAWGLPGISFDLEALKTYYPKGMIKTPCFDLRAFAENVIRLLENKDLYIKTKEKAIAWAREWEWDSRSKYVYDRIIKH